jgi:hypothetical protein
MAAPLIGLAARKAIKKAAKEVGETLGGIGLGTAGLYGASEIIGKDMEKKARKKLMKEGGSAARKLKNRFKKVTGKPDVYGK